MSDKQPNLKVDTYLSLAVKVKGQCIDVFSQLYLTGAVYSLDGSDSLKETMQTSIAAADKVTAWGLVLKHIRNVFTKFTNIKNLCFVCASDLVPTTKHNIDHVFIYDRV